MSTSTIDSTVRVEEDTRRRAAEHRARFVAELRNSGSRFVAANLDGFRARGDSDFAQLCELTGRFEAVSAHAPAELRDDVRSLFDRGAAAAELMPRVEQLEQVTAERYERRQVAELELPRIARDAGGVAGAPTWTADGKMRAHFRFEDGEEMGTELSERERDGTRQLTWLAEGSTIVTGNEAEDCNRRYEAVQGVAQRADGVEVQTPPPGSQLPPDEDREGRQHQAGA